MSEIKTKVEELKAYYDNKNIIIYELKRETLEKKKEKSFNRTRKIRKRTN